MSIINYSADKNLLVIARGHPYERDTIAAVFDTFESYNWSLVEQPAAQRLLQPSLVDDYEVCVCYDMPGVDFTQSDDPPGRVQPSSAMTDSYLAMLDKGMGMVFLHHALAAWPAWPTYAEIVGGRFHYRGGELRGVGYPDSGYRHEVSHTLRVAKDHPVTAGLPEQFEMTDELYLCPVFEDDIEPLLYSDYGFESENFYSASLAVGGQMFSREGWQHPKGSNVVGWVKHYRNSPIVYLQGGDDARAWNNPHYRQLLKNAIDWVASPAAHEWARARNSGAGNGPRMADQET